MTLPRVDFQNDPPPDESFIVTPAIVVTQGICACCEKPEPVFCISFQWLMWGFMAVIDFSGDKEVHP